MAQRGITIRQWLPLIGLTCAAFIFNTSEFMPIGLLTDIAASFHISEAATGVMISVYAWGVMLLSLLLRRNVRVPPSVAIWALVMPCIDRGRSPACFFQRAPGPSRVRPAPSISPGPSIATRVRPSAAPAVTLTRRPVRKRANP